MTTREGARILARAIVIAALCVSAGAGPEPASDAEGSKSAAASQWSARLTTLTPTDPMAYFELGEEVMDAATSDAQRELARQLLGLAGVLAPQTLGHSSCLALADLAIDPMHRRRLLALAWLNAPPGQRTLMVEGDRHPWSAPSADAALAVADAVCDFRHGAGPKALARLQPSAAMELLKACDKAIPGGVNRFLEDCRRYRGELAPLLSESDVTDLLRLQVALLAGDGGSWAGELLLTDGQPLVEVDPGRLDSQLGVDVSRPYWREGQWVAAP